MNRIITFLVCFAFFFSIFTPIRSVVSGGEALTMLIPVILIFIFDNFYLRLETYFFIFLLAIIACLGIIGNPYFISWRPDIITLAFGYFGFEHYLLHRDRFFAKWVLITTYLTLIGLVAISLPQFIAMPGLTRMMNMAAKDPTIDFNYYWAISYNTVHIIPTASIPLFVSFTNCQRGWKKAMFGVSSVLMTIIMVFADATTPLIIMVVIAAFFFLKNNNKEAQVGIAKPFLIAIMLLPIFFSNIMSSLLRIVHPVFVGSTIYYRIEDMITYSETGESTGDINSRGESYGQSIDAIISNPLFPETNIEKIGKHSHLVDHMAAMGLILFIPYALFLYNRFRRPLQYFHKNRMYYILAFISFLILALAKNFFIFTVACFLVPMYLMHIEQDT